MVCQCSDAYLVSDLHFACRGFDKAAVATVGRTGVQGAADFSGARSHVAHQHDATTLVGNGLRLHRAGVANHAAHQHTGTACGHHHKATVGFDQVFVLYQGIHHALVNLQSGQTLAAKDQGGFVAPRQGDRAFAGDDDALVTHLGRQHGDVATKRCLQRAKVHHAARFTVALEGGFTGHEVGVADTVGGNQKAADVHLRACPEQYAVGVDDEYLSWCIDTPHDLAGVVV